MDASTFGLVVSLISALAGGAVGAWIKGYFDRASTLIETKSEERQALIEGYGEISHNYNTLLTQLASRNTELLSEVERLEAHCVKLEDQLREVRARLYRRETDE